MYIESLKNERLDCGFKEKEVVKLHRFITETERPIFDDFVDINNYQKINIDLAANYDFVFENICEWLIDAKKGSKIEKILKSFSDSLIRCFSYCKNIETSNTQAHVMLNSAKNELEKLRFELDKESNLNKEIEKQLVDTIKSKKEELYYLKKTM